MLRQLALRLMLAILAVAALLAIYAIFDGSETTWRFVGTAFVLAVMIGLMLPCIPRDSIARAGLFQYAMLAHLGLGGGFLTATIWTPNSGGMPTVVALLYLWMFLGNSALVIAVPAFRHRRGEDRSLALAESVALFGAALAVVVAMGLTVVATGARIDSAFAAGYSILGGTAVAALAALGLRKPSSDRFTPPPEPQRTDRALAVLGLAGAAAATALALLAVAQDANAMRPAAAGQINRFWFLALAFASFAVPAAVACVLGMSRARGWTRAIHYVALATTATLGALNAYESVRMLVDGTAWRDPFLQRLNGALVVAAAASFLASLILMRISRGHRIASDPIESFPWTCPRCATQSRIAPGEHRCGVCGLTVSIALRDDRCPACGYDLHAQPAGVRECPECGRARQATAVASA